MEVLHIDGVYSRILCGVFRMIHLALELCNTRNYRCLLADVFSNSMYMLVEMEFIVLMKQNE